MVEGRILHALVVRKTKGRATVHPAKHRIGMMMRWESHREASGRRRTVHVRSKRGRRRPSVHTAHPVHAVHAVHATVHSPHKEMGRRRHIRRERCSHTVEELERHRRAIDPRWWQERRGWRGSLLLLGPGKSRRRGNLPVRLRRRRLRDRIPTWGWAMVLQHMGRSSCMNRTRFLIWTMPKHSDGRVLEAIRGNRIAIVPTVKLQNARIDLWRRRHL